MAKYDTIETDGEYYFCDNTYYKNGVAFKTKEDVIRFINKDNCVHDNLINISTIYSERVYNEKYSYSLSYYKFFKNEEYIHIKYSVVCDENNNIIDIKEIASYGRLR